ncbi:MAG: hypothetical protein JWO19_1350 [Bryobacterales bacterium]|jgi:hypothetical protein|nr:hypothetical protein [Bryobacterales bacterium]
MTILMTSRLIVVVGALLLSIGTGSAESHPAWWRYASPDATALVGIQWEHVRLSPFGDAIAGELTGDGGLGFPDLECLKEARQLLISSPAFLAVAAGNFPTATIREQAAKKGLKRALYRDVELWVAPGKETLSIARISDQLILLGRLKNLQDAIDRNLPAEADRAYSPLLARAARYAQDDLWVVAARLPDPLAERFVPIEAEAEGFEGGVSVENGLRLGAVLNASSEESAAQLAEALKQMVVSLPPVARGIQISIDRNNVTLGMAINAEQLLAGLRTATVAAAPVLKPEPAKPAGPQIIRIFGLDDGPREIVLH